MDLEIVTAPPRPVPGLEAMAEHCDVRVEWPLVIVAATRETPSFDTVQALTRLTDELFELRTEFAFVFDYSRLRELPDAATRRRAAEYQEERAEDFARWVVADASVVNQPLARGLLTAMGWLVEASHPERVFGTRAEAVAWARERLAAEGLRAPSDE